MVILACLFVRYRTPIQNTFGTVIGTMIGTVIGTVYDRTYGRKMRGDA